MWCSILLSWVHCTISYLSTQTSHFKAQPHPTQQRLWHCVKLNLITEGYFPPTVSCPVQACHAQLFSMSCDEQGINPLCQFLYWCPDTEKDVSIFHQSMQNARPLIDHLSLLAKGNFMMLNTEHLQGCWCTTLFKRLGLTNGDEIILWLCIMRKCKYCKCMDKLIV